jgi:hypothetical protein
MRVQIATSLSEMCEAGPGVKARLVACGNITGRRVAVGGSIPFQIAYIRQS